MRPFPSNTGIKMYNFLFTVVSVIIWLPVTRVCIHQGISCHLSFCVPGTHLLPSRRYFYGSVMFRAVLVPVPVPVCRVVRVLLKTPLHLLNYSPTLPLLGTGGGLDKCNILVGETNALRGGVALLLGMLTLLNDEDTESIGVFPDRFR